jgi:hypothetical protein
MGYGGETTRLSQRHGQKRLAGGVGGGGALVVAGAPNTPPRKHSLVYGVVHPAPTLLHADGSPLCLRHQMVSRNAAHKLLGDGDVPARTAASPQSGKLRHASSQSACLGWKSARAHPNPYRAATTAPAMEPAFASAAFEYKPCMGPAGLCPTGVGRVCEGGVQER